MSNRSTKQIGRKNSRQGEKVICNLECGAAKVQAHIIDRQIHDNGKRQITAYLISAETGKRLPDAINHTHLYDSRIKNPAAERQSFANHLGIEYQKKNRAVKMQKKPKNAFESETLYRAYAAHLQKYGCDMDNGQRFLISYKERWNPQTNRAAIILSLDAQTNEPEVPMEIFIPNGVSIENPEIRFIKDTPRKRKHRPVFGSKPKKIKDGWSHPQSKIVPHDSGTPGFKGTFVYHDIPYYFSVREQKPGQEYRLRGQIKILNPYTGRPMKDTTTALRVRENNPRELKKAVAQKAAELSVRFDKPLHNILRDHAASLSMYPLQLLRSFATNF